MKKIHFVAIGGQGMSGIARILLDMGYDVTGSDLKLGTTAERLMKMGARVFLGHRKENIENPDMVVVSSAINQDNPEVIEAKRKGIPVIHRMDMLLSAISGKKVLAVAGSHGKTTTTSMLAWILEKEGLDPTYLVGGEFSSEGNAHLGKGEMAVVELDESDGSFLKARPHLSVVTNVDNDHLEYWGSAQALQKGFLRFLNNTEKFAIVCTKDPLLRTFANDESAEKGNGPSVITYALEGDAEWTIKDFSDRGLGSHCIIRHEGQDAAELTLKVPGLHNVEDALGAIAAASCVGVHPSRASLHLKSFVGAKRRLEPIGTYNGVTVIDDFAHHPSEIKASLRALKRAFSPHKVLVVFQPHRYSRTKCLYQEFGHAFDDADSVIIAGIYAGPGETPDPSINSSILVDSLRKSGHPSANYMEDMYEGGRALARVARPGDVVVTMGAGDVYKTHVTIAETLLQNP